MSSKIIAGLGLVALLATPAVAADLSYRAPNTYAYAAPAAAFTWQGFYLGANAGYGWGDANISKDLNGFAGGFQAGYNWQFNSLVLGLETDLQGANISSSTFDLDYFGTVRARAGVALDQFLLYGTAGLAYGGGTYELAYLSNDQTHTGWTIGAGGEYAITPNWSVKAEYLYVDLNKQTYTSVVGPVDVGATANIVRAGVNYHF
ncbi:outer membrane protein [Ancylobacter amanitiformis]|uniref:Outer membrane immunogenic protein n=1 Tax=Ancylobacter amanitiformis TaxID=217069 RepID=A0ABU0LLY2_9HYPH|nr:outer membrane protein [Ancylobacter amanitiformis]MDQ0509669.1 outer membrane immunogenic protein [Ancylobacter amanitiformis]